MMLRPPNDKEEEFSQNSKEGKHPQNDEDKKFF